MDDIKKEEELVDFWEEVEVTEEEVELDPIESEEVDEVEESEETDETEESEETEETDEVDETDDNDDEDNEEELDEDKPLVESIKERLGFEFEQEFEDTEDGIQDLVEAASKQLADEALDTIFSEYPDVKELFEYRQLGGDPDKFFQTKFPEVDYEEVEFKEDDDHQHEQLVRQELQVRGYSADEIEAEITDYRNGGILESKAKRALNALKVKQQGDKESLLEQQQEEARRQAEEVEQYWNGVNKTISESKTFKGLNVPSSDKDKFFAYISKPVKDGKSQRDLDVEASDMETRLAIDFLLYKGFDLSGIVARKAKDNNAKTLRERIRRSKLNGRREERKSSGELEELGEI